MYRSQGNIWLRVEILSSQSCYLEFFCIFLKRTLAYLYPHRFSQVTHYLLYLTKACFNLQKFSSILTLHFLPDQNRIRGEECHTLRSKTLEIKNLSTLAGILLIRGTMGYHFSSFFLFFKWIVRYP